LFFFVLDRLFIIIQMDQPQHDLFFFIEVAQVIAHRHILQKQGLSVLFANDLIHRLFDVFDDGFIIPGKQGLGFRQPIGDLLPDDVVASVFQQFADPGDDVVLVICQESDFPEEERFFRVAAQDSGNRQHAFLLVFLIRIDQDPDQRDVDQDDDGVEPVESDLVYEMDQGKNHDFGREDGDDLDS